jgi:hypothetical protein
MTAMRNQVSRNGLRSSRTVKSAWTTADTTPHSAPKRHECRRVLVRDDEPTRDHEGRRGPHGDAPKEDLGEIWPLVSEGSAICE